MTAKSRLRNERGGPVDRRMKEERKLCVKLQVSVIPKFPAPAGQVPRTTPVVVLPPILAVVVIPPTPTGFTVVMPAVTVSMIVIAVFVEIAAKFPVVAADFAPALEDFLPPLPHFVA